VPNQALQKTRPATSVLGVHSSLTRAGLLSWAVRRPRALALTYAFDKAKVPQGLSYPLKRSVLDAALLEAGVSGIRCVYYWLRQRGHIVMRADFSGEGRRGWAAAGLASITVYAVPSSDRQVIEAALVSQVLPRMICWLRELESPGTSRRGVDHHFVAGWEAGAVEFEMS
jgi:hypothetical protein